MKNIYILFILICVPFVSAAHFQKDAGQMWCGAGGYTYNATESDPYSPGSPTWRWETQVHPDQVWLANGESISTAWGNQFVECINAVVDGVALVNVSLGAQGDSTTIDSFLQSFSQFETSYYNSQPFGLHYKIVSDGEPAGTAVKVRLGWAAVSQISGMGGQLFFNENNTGRAITVTINSNPNDSTPDMNTIIYSSGGLYFTADDSMEDTVDFIARVGDTIGIYLGGNAQVHFNKSVGSGTVHGEFAVSMEIAAGRNNVADINKDRKVNLEDLAIMAENWLWEAPPAENQTCETAFLVLPGLVYEENTIDTAAGELWYKMTPNTDGRYTVSLCGSDFDTRLTVYYDYADTCPGYYWGENEDYCGLQSQLMVDCWAGTTYFFRIDSSTGQHGNMRLEVTPIARPANDDYWSAQEAFEEAVYTGNTEGSVGDGYVWYWFVPTTTNYYTLSLCGSSFDTMIELYDASITILDYNDNGPNCWPQSEMPVLLEAGSLYYIAVGSSYGDRGDYQFQITEGAPLPANDDCASAELTGLWYWISGSTAAASGSDMSSCGTDDSLDVWYRFTAPQDRLYYFQFEGHYLPGEKTLALYDASGCPGTEILCNAVDSGMGWITVEYTMTAGQEVLIRIAGVPGQSGYFSLYVH